MIYAFDCDDTICKTEGTDYYNSIPYPERIEKINRLYDAGHVIKRLCHEQSGRTNNAQRM